MKREFLGASLALVSALIAPAAHAVEGDLLPDSEQLKQACAILYYTPDLTKYVAMCSGTIIGDRELITAAHCEAEGNSRLPTEIVCPNGVSRFVVARQSHPRYETHGYPHDLALLEVSAPFGVPSIKLSDSGRQLRGLLESKPLECRVMGYGNSDGIRGLVVQHVGVPNLRIAAQFKPFRPEWGPLFLDLPPDKDDHILQLEPGDSGGPLVCRRPGGEWVLAGVHHGIDLGDPSEDTMSLTTYVGNELEWIHQALTAPAPALAPVPCDHAGQPTSPGP